MNFKKILSQANSKAEWVGLRYVEEKQNILSTKKFSLDNVQRNATRGVMIDVMVNGQFSYYATPFLDEKHILECIDIAVNNAQLASKFSVFKFDHDEVRKGYEGTYKTNLKSPLSNLSVNDIKDLAFLGSKNMMNFDKRIVHAATTVELIERNTRIVSTNGADIDQKMDIVLVELSSTAQDKNDSQTRSNHGMRGHCFQAGAEFIKDYDIQAEAKQISNQAIELLEADQCPTEVCDLVLAPDQMMLQIHESVGHPLELDRILGDERNFAGSSFVNLEDFGTLQYGSELMNIIFDPTVDNQLASYNYDDGGMPATKEHLIKDGVLIRGLGGIESQIRSGVDGVSNLRASSWNRIPIDRMANINLEPGVSTKEEIIGSIERGVYMESNRSWSIDDYRNKFQFGCEYAKLIENGELTKVVKNPNYRGITNPFWRSLSMTGNEDTYEVFGTPNCGKGEPNQVERVGHASPLCKFDKVQVFGGT
jgi:predicted Zn-dependent protease